MQLILHYDETYREVKYSNIRLEDIDRKVLMGINVTPVAALLYTPILIRMAQKYYEYINYKEEQEKEKQRAPRDACNAYIIVFQTIFYSCFHLSFVCAQMPMVFFLNNYLYQLNHTLFAVRHCGTLSHGTLPGFNKTVLQSLPRSVNLIIVESALMAAAFLAMLVVSAGAGGDRDGLDDGRTSPAGILQVLVLCGAAYRPMEEIDMRSIGWGNIFQLPFKHMRDYRLRHLFPLFIYSGFEVLFVCTGFSLVGSVTGWEVMERGQVMLSPCSLQNYGVCALGLERLAYLLMAYGFSASDRLTVIVPHAKGTWHRKGTLIPVSATVLLGMLYKKKERQDFIFTIYHWWQALAIFAVYLWSGLPMKAKLSIMLLTLVVAVGTYLWMERKVAWN
ncbi:hypothetical protein EK904_006973, partial [Melospiza melodia maxima]